MRNIPRLLIACLFISPGIILAQPIHDEPCTGLPLVVNEGCVFTTADNSDATLTISVPTPVCGNLSNADVWYTITAPAAGLLRISSASGSINDAAMALYSAPSCNGPFTLLACDDDAGLGSMPLLHFTDLTPNSTLYLRVWGYGGATGNFSLCAVGPLVLPEGDCHYLLEMTDSFGDGWGTGAQVGFSINGSSVAIDSLESGDYAARIFAVDIGDAVMMSYYAGAFNEENGVTLSVIGFNIPLFAGSNIPSSGQLFTHVADCQSPPPSPGDCPSATPLCHDTIFPVGALTAGFEAELNAMNRGCLASGERQGLWARFTIATDGTLAFTLDPGAQTDLDFAVWGPMNGLECPPTGAPIRCSYSALAGLTGLSTSAMDNSEGAGGDGRVSAMTVLAGQQYLLYIDNFSQNSQALALTWQLSDGATLMCPDAPEAQFSISSSLVLVGEPVNFIDQSSNAPVAWSWTFTGGTPSSSTAQDPAGIVYQVPGCYDVALTAYNPGGEGSTEQLCVVEVDASTGLSEVTSPIRFSQDAEGLTLRSTDPDPMQVMVFDAMGRTLLTGQGSGLVRLSTASISTGYYVVLVLSAQGTWTDRIVIAK